MPEDLRRRVDAVGSEMAQVAVHRRRKLTSTEAATLGPEFWAAEGSPACPALRWEP